MTGVSTKGTTSRGGAKEDLRVPFGGREPGGSSWEVKDGREVITVQ